jgi:hypothetical protein
VIMVDVTDSSMIMITLDVEADSSLRFEELQGKSEFIVAARPTYLLFCLVMVIQNCTPLLGLTPRTPSTVHRHAYAPFESTIRFISTSTSSGSLVQ